MTLCHGGLRTLHGDFTKKGARTAVINQYRQAPRDAGLSPLPPHQSLTMTAFTRGNGRETLIMGTHSEFVGNGRPTMWSMPFPAPFLTRTPAAIDKCRVKCVQSIAIVVQFDCVTDRAKG